MASAYVLNTRQHVLTQYSDLAATYAALILADEGLEITVRMTMAAIKAARMG